MGFLVSPTEPPYVKRLGRTSSIPELYGADVLWESGRAGKVGVQRKAYADLVDSVYDGRLGSGESRIPVRRCVLRLLAVAAVALTIGCGDATPDPTPNNFSRIGKSATIVLIDDAKIRCGHVRQTATAWECWDGPPPEYRSPRAFYPIGRVREVRIDE